MKFCSTKQGRGSLIEASLRYSELATWVNFRLLSMISIGKGFSTFISFPFSSFSSSTPSSSFFAETEMLAEKILCISEEQCPELWAVGIKAQEPRRYLASHWELFQAPFIFIHFLSSWGPQSSMLWSEYWCKLQACGNMWHLSRHRRIHRVYDWVYNNRASLLHVWCRPTYYSRQVSLLKLDGERWIIIHHLPTLIY